MSFFKSLGKGLLKAGKMAAPALNFVPGGQFINAGIGALDTKVNQGGSWGDALKSGLMSGITGGLAKGLGPSKVPGMMDESGAFGGMKSGGLSGFAGKLKNAFGGGSPTDFLRGDINAVDSALKGPGTKLPWGKILGAGIGGGLAGWGLSKLGGGGGNDSGGDGMWGPQTSAPAPNQYSPDLGPIIAAGRNQAMADQPWRKPLQVFDENSAIQPFGGQAMQTRAVNRNRGARM